MKPKLFMERGQALVLIALAAIGLFGITGLAIDGSAKFSDRRHAQNAADTAAMAGALELARNETPHPETWDIVAKNVADDNGYDGDLVRSQVWVYKCSDLDVVGSPRYGSPADCGPTYNGDSHYIQVAILSNVDTYFARVIGIQQTKNVVAAVAMTKEGGLLGDGAMLISYDPHPHCSGGAGSGGGSVDISGNATINLTGGGIFLNSQETCGYSQPSCSVILTIGGGAGVNSAANVDNIDLGGCGTATENIDQDPVIIPDDVEMPDEPDECTQLATAYNQPVGSNTWHITPGYYSDFPQASINGNIVGIKKDIIMDPGTYCVGKSIHWSGNTFYSLDGSSGVTIYLKPGVNFDLSINSPITLYAQHSGSDYDGYIIIQAGTNTSIGSCTINGGVYLDLEGTVFAPYCNITVNGGSDPTAEINAQLLGWDLKLNGNNTINFNYDPYNKAKVKSKVGLMR